MAGAKLVKVIEEGLVQGVRASKRVALNAAETIAALPGAAERVAAEVEAAIDDDPGDDDSGDDDPSDDDATDNDSAEAQA